MVGVYVYQVRDRFAASALRGRTRSRSQSAAPTPQRALRRPIQWSPGMGGAGSQPRRPRRRLRDAGRATARSGNESTWAAAGTREDPAVGRRPGSLVHALVAACLRDRVQPSNQEVVERACRLAPASHRRTLYRQADEQALPTIATPVKFRLVSKRALR